MMVGSNVHLPTAIEDEDENDSNRYLPANSASFPSFPDFRRPRSMLNVPVLADIH